MRPSLENAGNQHRLDLRLTWPRMADLPFHENFYLGGWHPNKQISVEWTDLPPTIQPEFITSANWFMLSNRSHIHAHQPGLVHARAGLDGSGQAAVAFRGYLVDPPIHSYSPAQEIFKFWQDSRTLKFNGVFSAACIRNSGASLELINDALGMAPLYYRFLGEAILFATNPRFLTTEQDEPDYLAWRCHLQARCLPSDRTLSSAIKRVPSGHTLRFVQQRIEHRPWFDFGTLPSGTRPVNANAIAEVEEAFQSALSRCLRLDAASYFLPLSSGYDSRRILAGLIDRNVPFQAATVRVLQKGDRDLDAPFATLMAIDLGFEHQEIETQNPSEYAEDDYRRRILIAAESCEHTWALSLMRSLPQRPTVFFDGLAGDALGETGYDWISGLHVSPESDHLLIARHEINDDFDTILRRKRWPSAAAVRNELCEYIESLPAGVNRTELAFLLLHTRRSTALWSQQMLPAGHVGVYPYLDLDYIRTTLQYDPQDKLKESFQKSCLQTYWPRYFAYPGNRDFPSAMPPGSPAIQQERQLACFNRTQQELDELKGGAHVRDLLSRKACVRLSLARQSRWVALRSLWAFLQLQELVAQHTGKIACWKIVAGK